MDSFLGMIREAVVMTYFKLLSAIHVEGVGGKMGSEWILGRLAWGVWIGFDRLRTGTGGGLL
jgi:hypothetical protein